MIAPASRARRAAALLATLAALRADGGEALAGAVPTLAARAARFPEVARVTADFVQEREVSLVDEVLHARGVLALAAPTSFRLDLAAPEPMTLIASDTAMTVVDSDGKAMAVPAEFAGLASFARTLTDLLLGRRAPLGFTEAWRDPETVVLTPPADAASPFSEIMLRFRPDGPLPETIVMRERGGDRTTIRLERVVLNPPLDPARFTPPPRKGS